MKYRLCQKGIVSIISHTSRKMCPDISFSLHFSKIIPFSFSSFKLSPSVSYRTINPYRRLAFQLECHPLTHPLPINPPWLRPFIIPLLLPIRPPSPLLESSFLLLTQRKSFLQPSKRTPLLLNFLPVLRYHCHIAHHTHAHGARRASPITQCTRCMDVSGARTIGTGGVAVYMIWSWSCGPGALER